MIATMYAVTMLAAMLVLLTPWSAWAECAWVLWQEISGVSGGQYNEDYGISIASGSESQCRRDAAEQLQARAAQLRRTGIASDVKIEGPYVRYGLLNYRYLCLPDTVDPRGPKGSGR